MFIWCKMCETDACESMKGEGGTKLANKRPITIDFSSIKR